VSDFKPGDRVHVISAWFVTVPDDLTGALISHGGEPCEYEVVTTSGVRTLVDCLTIPCEGLVEVETSHLIPAITE
jgi:hypothetical protein